MSGAWPPILLRADEQLISFAVLQDCERAPLLALGLLHELDAFRFQLFERFLDVVDLKRTVEERADAIFVAVRREENDLRLRTADAHLDPALAWSHRLVGGHFEAEFVAIKRQRAFLISNGNPSEFQLRNHHAQECSDIAAVCHRSSLLL